jgi:hypothetical protein
MIGLTPAEIDATVKKVLPQLPDGHSGALVTDVTKDGVTFAAELQKNGNGWTLDAEAAFIWDWKKHTAAAGASIVWSWV